VRISEKTIELNFCARMTHALTPPFWWFGLTQAQEAQLGWDAAALVGGHWTLFQVKASNRVLANGRRRFNAQHHQMVALMGHAAQPGDVYYVLPRLGNEQELAAANFDLLGNLSLLDANAIPGGIGPPTTASGQPRQSGVHYMDLHPGGGAVTIRSEPVEVRTAAMGDVSEVLERRRRQFVEERREVGRNEVAVVREFLATGRNRAALLLPPT
jgi:hypothetical protein